ncbi:MAG: ribonuclease HII [Coriobacteriales bacterium]|jgi:ribonuclease HII|nr:ribonuclease HII [Coriobacteriales bacterium]
MDKQTRTAALYGEQLSLCAGLAAGLDEVGRGSVAGPLTVAAVVLPAEPRIQGLNDSKKLTEKQRDALAVEIRYTATAIALAHVSAAEIDAGGMAAALRQAFGQALGALRTADGQPLELDAILLDGNPLGLHPREISVVKGDGRVACIAAASIIAKVTRDALMVELAEQYPAWQLASNKGYASPAHIAAIREHGLTPIHRRSFCSGFFQEQIPFADV